MMRFGILSFRNRSDLCDRFGRRWRGEGGELVEDRAREGKVVGIECGKGRYLKTTVRQLTVYYLENWTTYLSSCDNTMS